MPLERIHDVIAVFPLDGQGSDTELSPEDEARYAEEIAKARELDELVIKSPWAAAACEIAAAAYTHETFPLLGFQHRVWPADEESDDCANVRVMWGHEGHVYRLDLSFNVITGHGSVDLEVDKQPAMFIQVEMRGWDKPPRIDGSHPIEDQASPDGNIHGVVTGGEQYEPGPWEAVLIGVGEQLRQLQAAGSGSQAQ